MERAAQHAAFAPMLRDEEQRAAYLAILVSEETDMEALRHYTRQDFEEIGLPGRLRPSSMTPPEKFFLC